MAFARKNMVNVNKHYLKLKAGYLFPEIARRVNQFAAQNPQARIIRLGIGDVTQPLPQAVIDAGINAFREMADASTFKGYGPEQGYEFLRNVIVENDFQTRGVDIKPEEIFISDASKCDTANIQEIFAEDCRIAITDPVYPVYVDSNVMAGKTGDVDEKGQYAGLYYLETNAQGGFLPQIPKIKLDVIYLCFPNNPTGVVATKAQLQEWVNYARNHDAVILFDAAYEAYITDEAIPHSIYEIPGARECAIEFRSFSKNAGFTGTRCAYVVVPKELKGKDPHGNPVSIHALWHRRQSTKFNGVSYPVQRAAFACYSAEGKKQIKNLISYYLGNAHLIFSCLKKLGLEVHGATNSPYIWFKTPGHTGSWDFFDQLLNKAHVVGTPGAGFGACGEGYFRLSAFGSTENIKEALARIEKVV